MRVAVPLRQGHAGGDGRGDAVKDAAQPELEAVVAVGAERSVVGFDEGRGCQRRARASSGSAPWPVALAVGDDPGFGLYLVADVSDEDDCGVDPFGACQPGARQGVDRSAPAARVAG
ncbi:hypothetical protein ABZ570_29355 [Micromonospora sp. NPDC007271]|uniref:hypothetical protein n=1 Tax=Micromonospora sp. NPDC007271 TaxID=3154587 RepID=UPI0033F59587